MPIPRFCHQCGGCLRDQFVPAEQRARLVCESCGFIHYLNPRVVAAAIPERDGRILLMRRALEPRRGYWTFPGGFLEVGETAQEGARREAEEEVGVSVELGAILGAYTRRDIGIVVVVFRAQAPEEEPQPGEEALEVGWFTPEAIPWEELAFPTTEQALREWVKLGA